MLSLPLELIIVIIEELWQIDSRQYRQCASSGLNALYPADRIQDVADDDQGPGAHLSDLLAKPRILRGLFII
ncbi:hypothetical protein BDZ89DRAFT_1061844 [Hymenopellis radicata]|nr:hypothetical protein BDZ89DRAFT_1061844 [Hymenopellis radicata]